MQPPHAALRPPKGPRTIVLVLDAPLSGNAVALLCGRLGELLGTPDVDVVTCDVAALTEADGETIEAVARLQLTAHRMGRSIRLRYASGDLQDLIAFVGLGDVIPVVPAAPAPAG
jgi:ABC-type transporter Mla MlaB component